MFSLVRTLSFRYLRQRWDRVALVVVSIALGVATLVSSSILNKCLDLVAGAVSEPVPGADLYVTNGEAGVFDDVIHDIRAANLPEVESANPLIVDRVELTQFERRPAILVGLDMLEILNEMGSGQKTQQVERLDLKVEGIGEYRDNTMVQMAVRILAKTRLSFGKPYRAAVISRNLFTERTQKGIPENDPLIVRIANTQYELIPCGVIDLGKGGDAAAYSRNLIVMEAGEAARVLRTPAPPKYLILTGGAGAKFPELPLSSKLLIVTGGLAEAPRSFGPARLTRIDVFLKKDAKGRKPVEAERDRIKEGLQKIVRDRASVRTPDQQRKSTEDVVGGIRISFELCSVGALVVGLFLVYNAMSVSVAERRHDIGILRATGATRWQIGKIFTVESMIMGCAGAVLGIPLGMGLADLALDQFREELQQAFGIDDLSALNLTWGTVFWAFTAGLGVSLFAALVPAIQAASDQPADAVRRAPSSAAAFFRVLHRLACAALVLGGVGMVLFRDQLPGRIGSYIGLVLTLVGLFLAMPLLVSWTARLLQPVFRTLLGIEARLAADNLLRAPARTGVVIGALGGGVALMFQTSGVGRSNEEPILEWIDQVLQADSYVFWGNLATANNSATPMEPRIANEIMQHVPGVERVVGFRYLRPEYADTVIYLIGIDAQDFHDALRARRDSSKLTGLDGFPQLARGNNCVVSDNFAIRYNKQIGDTITLPGGRHGQVTLHIVGKGKDYSWSKGTVFVDRERFAELFDDNFVDLFHVFYKQPDKSATPAQIEAARNETEAALQKVADMHQLLAKDRLFVRGYLTSVIDRIYKLAYIQQSLVGVVAALGVVTALLISVVQRRRELGLLRAVGATQGQVLRTVLAEAMLMGILGMVLGIALGLPMEWYLLRIILFEESGFYFDVLVPWGAVLLIGVLAVGVATLAGLAPAYHAARLRIADAIAYE